MVEMGNNAVKRKTGKVDESIHCLWANTRWAWMVLRVFLFYEMENRLDIE